MKAEVGKRYRHWKGNEYTVLAVGRHESDPAIENVVYRAEYASPNFGYGAVWIRERNNFEGRVVVNGIVHERFSRIDDVT